jgi:tetratricopeptide (TPR) repeat protein
MPPDAVARAADITLMSTRTASEADANQLFARLEPILISTLARIKQDDPNEIDRSTCITLLALLGFGNEFLGKTQVALDFYSQGLRVQPDNDALLVARGMLLYGASPRAITDLELAIQYGSPLIWPSVFLAHHYLLSGNFEECRKLCERSLSISGSAAVKSEVSEWMAISLAELGFPAEMVQASFDNAIRFDPSNERAKRNLAVFEAARRPVTVKQFDVRTAGSLRSLGLAERRFSTAA